MTRREGQLAKLENRLRDLLDTKFGKHSNEVTEIIKALIDIRLDIAIERLERVLTDKIEGIER